MCLNALGSIVCASVVKFNLRERMQKLRILHECSINDALLIENEGNDIITFALNFRIK